MHAERTAQVPVEAPGRRAAQTADQRGVGRRAYPQRREAAREQLLKREAVRVVDHLLQGGLIGHVVGHGDGGAVGRAHAAGREHVADEQRAAAVGAEHPEPGVRVPVEDAQGHGLAGVARVGVGLYASREGVAEVAEQLQVIVDLRIAPGLRAVGPDVRVASSDERDGVAARRGPVGPARVAVLDAEVGEPGGAERQADVAGEPGRLPVAGAVHAGVELHRAARASVLELEVHHPGDRVRAVLGRRAVAQHFDLPEGNRGDGGDVGALRAERHAVAAVPVDDRRPVAALAVDEDQRVVGGEVAQHRGADHRRVAADRLTVDAERRNDGAKLVVQVARAPAEEVRGRQHVHRDRRLGGAARLGAGADDHRLLGEPREQVPHLRRRQPQRLDLGRRHTEGPAQLLGQRARRRALHLPLRSVVLKLRARIHRERGRSGQEHGHHQGRAPARTSGRRCGFRAIDALADRGRGTLTG